MVLSSLCVLIRDKRNLLDIGAIGNKTKESLCALHAIQDINVNSVDMNMRVHFGAITIDVSELERHSTRGLREVERDPVGTVAFLRRNHQNQLLDTGAYHNLSMSCGSTGGDL